MSETLASGFPEIPIGAWRDAARKGLVPDTELLKDVEPGVRTQWLYTSDDALAPDPAGSPGESPFVRGTRVGAPWQIRQQHVHPERAVANRQILEDLMGGVGSIGLRLDRAARLAYAPGSPEFLDARGHGGIAISTLTDLSEVLDGVHLDLAPIALDAGAQGVAAAALLRALWQQNGIADVGARGSFCLDPLETLATDGHLPHSPEAAIAAAGALAEEVDRTLPGVTALSVDTGIYVEAGSTAIWELAISASSGLEYLRAADRAGLPPSRAARQIEFNLAIGADQFLEMAKFRAARRIWTRILEQSGVPPAERHSTTVGRTSARVLSAVDPWINMLRGTIATFAAGTAGADGITVTAFDRALGEPGTLGRRIARNTQIVLQEESSLGRISDPAAGSWYIESLTDSLARTAWEKLTMIEREGGALAALRSGLIASELAELAENRREELATRARTLTGVNAFPLLGDTEVLPDPVDHEALARLDAARLAERPESGLLENLAGAAPSNRLREAGVLATAGARIDEIAEALAGETFTMAPLSRSRDSSDFEHLRLAASRHEQVGEGRPKIYLSCLGPIARHVGAANWAKSFFEVGGIETIPSGVLDGPTEQGRALATNALRMAAICAGRDEEPGAIARTVEALRANGAEWVYLANPRPEQADVAGADEVVRDGVDMVEVLSEALGRLGVEVG